MNDIHICFRRGNTAFALLLKTVQDEYSLFEFHCIDGAICTADIILYNLNYSSTMKSL